MEPRHQGFPIKVCVVCGRVDVDQNTCNACRRKIAKSKKTAK